MPTFDVAIDARKARAGADEFERSARRVSDSAGQAAGATTRLDARMDSMGRTAVAVRSKMQALVGGVSAFLAVTRGVRQITEFETALVGVGKTTNILGDELERLGDDFIQLSGRVPISAKELLNLGQAAGQLGVTGSKNIQAFAETVAKLGTASNLSGEQAATTLARLLNIAGESAGTVDVLASVIVRLGNEFAATEAEIASVAEAVSQNTAAFDVTSAQAAALGAAMRALGIEAEVAGSSVGKTFTTIDEAVRKGGDALKLVSGIAGQTSEEFSRLFNQNQTAGFQAFVEGLGRVADAGGSVNFVLEELGLEDIRVQRVLSTLAVNSKELGRALSTTADELKNVSALETEAARAFDTISGQAGRLKNTITAAALQFRDARGPIKDFLANLRGGIADVVGLNGTFKEGAPLAREYAAAIGALAGAAGFGALATVLPSIVSGITALGAALVANPLLAFATAAAAAAGAIFAMRNEIVTLGGTTAKVSDFVSAAFSVLGDRVQLVFRALQITFRGTFDFLRDNVKSALDQVSKFFGSFFGDFDVNWSAVFDGALETVTFWANKTVQLLVGVGSSLIALAGKFDDFSAALLQFDPSNPIESFRDVTKQIKFASSELAFDVRKGFGDAFNTDFIGEVSSAVTDIFKVAKTELEAEGKVQLPESVRAFFDPSEIGKEIAARAAELRRARDEAAIAPFQDIIGKTVQLAALSPFVVPDAARDRVKDVTSAIAGLGNTTEETRPKVVGFWGAMIAGAQKAAEKLKILRERELQAVQNTADDIGRSFGDAFEKAIVDGEEFRDVLKSLIQDVIRELFRFFVVRQITTQVSAGVSNLLTTSASGNVFEGGRKTLNFAGGGIFERETTLQGAQNTRLRFAEAGRPEGAFPLTRDSRGNLAVSAVMPQGSGGRSVTVVQNISTPDLDGFRSSRRQLARRAKRDLGDA